MNGVLIINKSKGLTSRDVVNRVEKVFKTKKVGHTGTLDPIATGVLVVCVGKATKLVNFLTCSDKEYIATVCLGIETPTLDTESLSTKNVDCIISKDKIKEVLDKFVCTYNQEVPIYSAVKVNGKKLYEYARENIDIVLPKRDVTIYNMSLVDYYIKDNKTYFSFKCKVSKGTYIRSLIRDIALNLNTVGIMTDLKRIKQGTFSIEQSISDDDINTNDLISIKDILNVRTVELNGVMEKKVINGCYIEDKSTVLFVKEGKEIALYENGKCKIMFGGI